MGVALVIKGCRNQSEKQGTKKKKIFPPFKPQTFLVANGLTIKQIHYNMHFQRIVPICYKGLLTFVFY